MPGLYGRLVKRYSLSPWLRSARGQVAAAIGEYWERRRAALPLGREERNCEFQANWASKQLVILRRAFKKFEAEPPTDEDEWLVLRRQANYVIDIERWERSRDYWLRRQAFARTHRGEDGVEQRGGWCRYYESQNRWEKYSLDEEVKIAKRKPYREQQTKRGRISGRRMKG